MKAYVLGNENAVLGLALVGMDGQMIRQPEELGPALDRCLADKTIGLVLITGDVAVWARERVDALKLRSAVPLVVEIPGESTGMGYPALTDLVQRAIGITLGEQ